MTKEPKRRPLTNNPKPQEVEKRPLPPLKKEK